MEWEHVCEAPAQLKLASLNARACASGYQSTWHSHPFAEWGMVLEGECEWQTAGESFLLKENEIFLLGPAVAHREVVPATSRARLAWIGFSSAAFSSAACAPLTAKQGEVGGIAAAGSHADPVQTYGAAGAVVDISGIPVVDGDGSAPVTLQTVLGTLRFEGRQQHKLAGAECVPPPRKLSLGIWDAEVRRLFLTLYDEQSEPAYGSEVRIGLCMRELLLLTARALRLERSKQVPDGMTAPTGEAEPDAAATHGLPRRQVQLANAASRYFDNNTGKGVTVESVARYFRLTPQYFSTVFRKVHGVSPVQYLQGARARQARRLLVGTRYSVKEIAAQCGYADSAHFCRQFKQQDGRTPAQYRLSHSSGKA